MYRNPRICPAGTVFYTEDAPYKFPIYVVAPYTTKEDGDVSIIAKDTACLEGMVFRGRNYLGNNPVD